MRRSTVPSRLIEQHRGPMVRYLRRRLGDDAAEDATIEVFERALRAAASSEDQRSPRARLYAIATAEISTRWRTERSRLEALEWLARQPPVPHPALVPASRLDPRIATTLRGLPAIDRETLLLTTWGELGLPAVAETLSISVDATQRRLADVAERLRAAALKHTDDAITVGRSLSGTPDQAPGDLLTVLSDNGDLGLNPARQPRIESAVNHRIAAPMTRPRAQASGPQPIGA